MYTNEQGQVVSFDNRRLLAAKEAGVPIVTYEVSTAERDKLLEQRFYANSKILLKTPNPELSTSRIWNFVSNFRIQVKK